MGVALYIVSEKAVENFEAFVNGKYVGTENPRIIDNFCKELGVKSLNDFLSMDEETFADLTGEQVTPASLPNTKWFKADEGLITVRTLLEALETTPEKSPFKNTAGFIEDLREYLNLLEHLGKHNIDWHFEFDI